MVDLDTVEEVVIARKTRRVPIGVIDWFGAARARRT